jgi:hypothetical protein
MRFFCAFTTKKQNKVGRKDTTKLRKQNILLILRAKKPSKVVRFRWLLIERLLCCVCIGVSSVVINNENIIT